MVCQTAAEIRIRAERRIGELIVDAKKAGQVAEGRPSKNCSDSEQFPRVRLEDAGIDRKLSSRAQKLAAVPEIELHGWTNEPITVWQDHNILVDGHRRLAIWEEQKTRGVDVGEPQVKEMPFQSKSEALIWMSIHQESRRNLSESQRAMLATKLVPHYAEMGKKRMREGGGDKKSDSAKEKSGEADVPHPIRRPQARDEAAQALGVGGRTVSKAWAVREYGSEELIKAVEAGEVTVNRAEKIARTVPKENQLKEAKAVKRKPKKEKETPAKAERKTITGERLLPKAVQCKSMTVSLTTLPRAAPAAHPAGDCSQ